MNASSDKQSSLNAIKSRHRLGNEPEIPEHIAIALIAASLLLATFVFFSVYNLGSYFLNDYPVAFIAAIVLSSITLRLFPETMINLWKQR